MDNTNCVDRALSAFTDKKAETCEPYGNGHINYTYLASVDGKRYILQRMNTAIFKNPDRLMDNVIGVTAYIRNKVSAEGGDSARASLAVIPTLEGKSYYRDPDGECWRLFEFTEHAFARDRVESVEDFYNCAVAFGHFQHLLAEYPADTLYETIENFHNTPWRYDNLMKAVKADSYGRLSEVVREVEFAKARREFCSLFENARAEGRLPLRVTHNDTKLNNILFDERDGSAVCVIDLDTVMPGYSVNDFGDSIRFGANTAVEDERDLTKVSLDLELFAAYAKGFIEGCEGSLTYTELDYLPYGAMMMTLECGMRFLTDHLEGDTYFRIHRPGHNLDRCRCQFALVADMERKLEDMKKIINELK